MELGVVLQTSPPSARVIELARQAELYGFTHVWTFDSHVLWQEPFVIYSQILAATRKVTVGPMVTNPSTRDWTVTASLFATLNEMFGNRTVCGIGRGDSSVRVTNGRPATLANLRQAIHVIRELANGREVDINGATVRFPWGLDSRLSVWVAGYGPKALQLAGEVGDGYILQLADPDITAWTIRTVRAAATAAGRDPAAVRICVASPAYVGDDLAHMRDQCRWFGGMVGNHVAELVARYGPDSNVPRALTDYISGRRSYDYNEHGQAGNTHTDFVPDEIVDRFCILGDVRHHVNRLEELKALGVDQFAIYLQHDGKDATLRAYGEQIIGALTAPLAARSFNSPDAAYPVRNTVSRLIRQREGADVAWLDGRDDQGNPLPAPSVGGVIAVPGGDYLGSAYANGTQTYMAKEVTGADGQTQLEWDLIGPWADLTDATGAAVGHHDVGPIWSCYADSSVVQGQKIDPGEDHGTENLKWLLLKAVSTNGGVMGQVMYVQRVETNGGVPPQPPNSTADTASPPYTAIYHFWGTLPAQPDPAPAS